MERLRAAMAYTVIVDGRNLFVASEVSGFTYLPTGRPKAPG